jgi:glyoxylase I family protein
MIRGIEHMAIAAKDTARLARWYCDTLGFHVVVDGGQGSWFVGPPEGDAVVEIIRANDAQRHERQRNDPGWSHLAFTVTDFDATIRMLREKGVTFTGEPTGGMGEQRLAFFLDMDGNVLQIVDRPKPLGS